MDARTSPLQATIFKPGPATVFDALRRSLGSHAVDTSEETLVRYGRNLLPGGDRRFNREDPEECQRVSACYWALMAAYGQAGYPISRAPLDFQEEAMARLETFPEVCAAIKRALDPNGILSPGRYGIS